MAKHPYAIHEKELNAYRDHGSQYLQVKKGRKRRHKLVSIAKSGSKPIVEVGAAKHCLHCFQKEYTIHYEIFVRIST